MQDQAEPKDTHDAAYWRQECRTRYALGIMLGIEAAIDDPETAAKWLSDVAKWAHGPSDGSMPPDPPAKKHPDKVFFRLGALNVVLGRTP